MPFACMCIIFNSPVLYKFCFLYRMFLRPLFSLIQTAITLPIIKFSYITIDQSWTGHLYFSILLFSCTITGFARKDLYSMAQCINDIFQTFPHCLWTSRQIDDQCLSSNSCSCTAQHCTLCDRHTISTNRFRNSRNLTFNDFLCCFRRYISLRKPVPPVVKINSAFSESAISCNLPASIT